MSYERKAACHIPAFFLPATSMSSNDILSQFTAYATSHNLTVGSKRYRKERTSFIARQVNSGFERHLGSDATRLESWHKICRMVGIRDLSRLTTPAKCRKVRHLDGHSELLTISLQFLKQHKFVNIIDLVDALNAGLDECNTFPSRRALADDILAGRRYPLKAAKRNELLRAFLIEV